MTLHRLHETTKSQIARNIKHQMSESHSIKPFILAETPKIRVTEYKPILFGMMSESHSLTLYEKKDRCILTKEKNKNIPIDVSSPAQK